MTNASLQPARPRNAAFGPNVVELGLDFRVQGNSSVFTVEGWYDPETLFTWTAGKQSTLNFRAPRVPAAYRIELALEPFIPANSGLTQRLSIWVNFKRYGAFAFTASGLYTVEVELPFDAFGGIDMCSVMLEHPDAARPAAHVPGNGDQRLLAFAVRIMRVIRLGEADATIVSAGARAVAQDGELPPVAELLTQFESLGANCEFGILQRVCDAEPLGLFRFGGVGIEALIRGLECDFAGFGAPESIELHVGANQEYMIVERRYGLTYHSWAYQGQVAEETIRARETVRLPFLHRKLLHDLASGEKMFVFADHAGVAQETIERLHGALQRNARNTLLWVRQAHGAEEKRPPLGRVTRVKEGLLAAHLDKFVTGPWSELNVEQWIAICGQAWRLWRDQEARPQ